MVSIQVLQDQFPYYIEVINFLIKQLSPIPNDQDLLKIFYDLLEVLLFL